MNYAVSRPLENLSPITVILIINNLVIKRGILVESDEGWTWDYARIPRFIFGEPLQCRFPVSLSFLNLPERRIAAYRFLEACEPRQGIVSSPCVL